jgi:hypothetical protein
MLKDFRREQEILRSIEAILKDVLGEIRRQKKSKKTKTTRKAGRQSDERHPGS